jgi:hypothetical protein
VASLRGIRRGLVAFVAIALAGGDAAADRDWTSELLARADEVGKQVSALRGLKQKRRIKRDVVDESELRKRLIERAARVHNASELAAEARALKRWGLIPRDADYSALVVDVLTEQIAGFYDPEDATLYIAKRPAGDDAAKADMLLGHEIDHALQDQHFDLEKFTDIPGTEGDALLARRALVEGDGVVLMIELLLAAQGTPPPWGDPMVASTLGRTLELATGENRLSRAPLVLREQLLFPYHAGLGFVADLRRRHAWTKVDAAFKRPPRSTEQILHPDLYAVDERPIVIGAGMPSTLVGWDLGHHTVWGEAGATVFLVQHGVNAAAAATAAAGWGGDRVALFVPQLGDKTRQGIGVYRSVWDGEADAIEAEEAMVRAVDRLVDGTMLGSGVWLGLDGRYSWVERTGVEVTAVVGAPLTVANRLRVEIPAAMPIKKP